MPIQKIFVAGDSFGSGAGLASESYFPEEELFTKRFTHKELHEFFKENNSNAAQNILQKIYGRNPGIGKKLQAEEKKRSYCAIISEMTGIEAINIALSGGSLHSIAYNIFENMSGQNNLENTLLIINLTSIYRQMIPSLDMIYINILPTFQNAYIPQEIANYFKENSRTEYYVITALMAIKSIQHFASMNGIKCYYIDSHLYERSYKHILREGGDSVKKYIEQLPIPDLVVYPELISSEDRVWLPCGHHDHTVQRKIAERVIKDLSLV